MKDNPSIGENCAMRLRSGHNRWQYSRSNQYVWPMGSHWMRWMGSLLIFFGSFTWSVKEIITLKERKVEKNEITCLYPPRSER